MSHRAIFSFLFFLNMSVTNNYFSYTTNSAYRNLKNTKPTVRKERERERKRERERERQTERKSETERETERQRGCNSIAAWGINSSHSVMLS